MDNEAILLIYVGLFSISLTMLLFTSYNFTHNIPVLILIFGLMIITFLATHHAINSIRIEIDKDN